MTAICLSATFSVPTAYSESPAPTPGRYNVLFIAVDDMNTEAGAYGSDIAITPNIDRLAQRGTLFERAYTQQAVCNPSRASVMTGLRPDTLRVWDLHTHFRDTHPDCVTLPQYFKQHGYYTQGIGKIFHNWHKQTFQGDPESWSVEQTYHYGTHFSDWYLPGEPQGTLAKEQNGPTQCEDVSDETYFDGRIAQDAIQALNDHKDERFFLAVGFWKPHLPFNAPKKYWDLYNPDLIPGPTPPTPPINTPDVALHDYRELRGYAGMPKEGPVSPQQLIELRHGYYAAISFVDAQIGKLLDELDRLGLTENTVVVLWSDHGYHVGEHALWCKTTNFELDARVPMIISYPEVEGGARVASLVELLDLYPTIAELCELSIPEQLDGKSLAPHIKGQAHESDDVALSQFPRPGFRNLPNGPEIMGYSLRTDRYRYSEWRNWKTSATIATELYDHDNDPIESVNLAGQADWVSVVDELSGKLSSLAPPTEH